MNWEKLPNWLKYGIITLIIVLIIYPFGFLGLISAAFLSPEKVTFANTIFTGIIIILLSSITGLIIPKIKFK